MTSRAGENAEALKTPRAAGVAGVLFSVLFLTALALLLGFSESRSLEPADWVDSEGWKVRVALNLVPFSGIAFLWFVGVLRDRLGAREDRLFATVFLGSGLLFVALLFVSASVVGALLLGATANTPMEGTDTSTMRLVRQLAYNLAGVYALKMAAVFMLTASTLILRTRFTRRWVAFIGYGGAAVILLGSQWLDWTMLLFPLWVLAVSASILADEFARP